MAKVVVDANVLISSVFGGLPLEAINLALSHHEVFYSAEIENELNESFPKARVQISVPEDNVSLVPDNGKLVNRYSYAGHSFYEVEFPLAANSQQRIQLISESPRI